MATRRQFEKIIISKSDYPDGNGYVSTNTDNLINGIGLDMFEDDLIQGSGNELHNKFNSICSSSALTVNNFAFIKKHIKNFEFLNYSDFHEGEFERQFKTGLKGTPPNLDFVIENKDTVVAFESKYLELLKKKKVVFKDSYNKSSLNYLDDFWFSLIDQYNGKDLFLDVAQLIKHSIGLIKHNKDTKQNVVLVYIYWVPDNFDTFKVYSKHSKELEAFSTILNHSNDLKFISITYNQLWDIYSNSDIFNNHFDKVKKRYKIEI